MQKHIFSPQKCNANPISILLCVHSSKVTNNIHSKFEHTVKTWWTWDEKNHTDELSAAALAPHWRETVQTGAGLHSCGSLQVTLTHSSSAYGLQCNLTPASTHWVNTYLGPFLLLWHLSHHSQCLARSYRGDKVCKKMTWNWALRTVPDLTSVS